MDTEWRSSPTIEACRFHLRTSDWSYIIYIKLCSFPHKPLHLLSNDCPSWFRKMLPVGIWTQYLLQRWQHSNRWAIGSAHCIFLRKAVMPGLEHSTSLSGISYTTTEQSWDQQVYSLPETPPISNHNNLHVQSAKYRERGRREQTPCPSGLPWPYIRWFSVCLRTKMISGHSIVSSHPGRDVFAPVPIAMHSARHRMHP